MLELIALQMKYGYTLTSEQLRRKKCIVVKKKIISTTFVSAKLKVFLRLPKPPKVSVEYMTAELDVKGM